MGICCNDTANTFVVGLGFFRLTGIFTPTDRTEKVFNSNCLQCSFGSLLVFVNDVRWVYCSCEGYFNGIAIALVNVCFKCHSPARSRCMTGAACVVTLVFTALDRVKRVAKKLGKKGVAVLSSILCVCSTLYCVQGESLNKIQKASACGCIGAYRGTPPRVLFLDYSNKYTR